jgi:hypothetical protein
MDHKEERFIFIHVKIKWGEWQGTKQLVVFPKSISIVHLDQPLFTSHIITLSITFPRYVISCLSLVLMSSLCNFLATIYLIHYHNWIPKKCLNLPLLSCLCNGATVWIASCMHTHGAWWRCWWMEWNASITCAWGWTWWR